MFFLVVRKQPRKESTMSGRPPGSTSPGLRAIGIIAIQENGWEAVRAQIVAAQAKKRGGDKQMGVGNDPRYTPTTTFETFPFPAGMTPRDTAPKQGQAAPPCMAGDILAANIAAAARHLDQMRNTWLNPPEWVEWVITPEEEKAGFPKRPVAKPGFAAEVKKRTLTNLYNARPAWLDLAHKALDAAVAAAYGWEDYSPAMSDDDILKRLLQLNLERSGGIRQAAAPMV